MIIDTVSEEIENSMVWQSTKTSEKVELKRTNQLKN